MKAQVEGLWPGQSALVDDKGRRLGLVVRLVPESPHEVAELKRFCRMTEAFTFVIDDGYRPNSAHVAPVYGERVFRVVNKDESLDVDEG